MRQVAVLGAGSFGTALSAHLALAGHRVQLWARDAALAAQIQHRRVNAIYLPGVELPPSVTATSDLGEALAGSELIVAAVPSHGLRLVMDAARPHLPPGATIVSTTKGLEEGTLLRMSQLLADAVGDGFPVAVLSGPSFASEVAKGLPTAVVVAAPDARTVGLVQHEFRGRFLRLYGSEDVVGVEIGGALKNVIAIAAGVVEGMGLGPNAQAALVTRGLAEITRLASVLGGRRETLAGLAGLGDLVLTCTGALSRNRHVGIELAQGRRLDEIVGTMKMVAEGVRTTQAALDLGLRHGVELPIAAQIADVLAGRKDARTALEDLMLRPQRAEVDAG
ncbi:MAG: NAD(P)-dependent glycerol-3-phosphate dehydrogenase [Vicinamibacteria bacterium]|nr:NAD(P)-dependent glycerol-3-phosphate dehydrogenase [Vicinamibacteria bacterium]